MRHLRAHSLFWLLLLALCVAPAPAPLQAQNDQTEEPLSREERMQRHNERIRSIIEDRRQERLKRSQEAAGQERRPGMPDDPPVQEADDPQDEGEGTGEGVGDSPLQLGNVILYVRYRVPDAEGEYQLDTVVRADQRFVSEVMLQNLAAQPLDRIRIALKYDKRFLRPVRIFDTGVSGMLAEEPTFEVIERESILVYDATFERSRPIKEVAVLKIVWEALRPTEFTDLSFEFAAGDTELLPHTAVYIGDRNILGDPSDPIDGVLGGSILVLNRFRAESDRGEILQGKKEELREIYLDRVGAQAPAGIQLQGPAVSPAIGQEFDVDVMLNNPFGSVIDSVRFFVRFDPEVLEVVDNDRGNWIKRGINVHDGLFRNDYPFDFHKRNEVDNQRGLIRYSMAMGRSLTLPTGTFARIRFRALRPAALTRIELIEGRQGARDLTTLRTLGFDMMSTDPEFTTPVYSTPVLLEPVADSLTGPQNNRLTQRRRGSEDSPWPDPSLLPEIMFRPLVALPPASNPNSNGIFAPPQEF